MYRVIPLYQKYVCLKILYEVTKNCIPLVETSRGETGVGETYFHFHFMLLYEKCKIYK